jgi:hypothetical protein
VRARQGQSNFSNSVAWTGVAFAATAVPASSSKSRHKLGRDNESESFLDIKTKDSKGLEAKMGNSKCDRRLHATLSWARLVA